MVYSADGGIGKIAGVHLTSTGKMTTKFVVTIGASSSSRSSARQTSASW